MPPIGFKTSESGGCPSSPTGSRHDVYGRTTSRLPLERYYGAKLEKQSGVDDRNYQSQCLYSVGPHCNRRSLLLNALPLFRREL